MGQCGTLKAVEMWLLAPQGGLLSRLHLSMRTLSRAPRASRDRPAGTVGSQTDCPFTTSSVNSDTFTWRVSLKGSRQMPEQPRGLGHGRRGPAPCSGDGRAPHRVCHAEPHEGTRGSGVFVPTAKPVSFPLWQVHV